MYRHEPVGTLFTREELADLYYAREVFDDLKLREPIGLLSLLLVF
jgi:hypothetical protein